MRATIKLGLTLCLCASLALGGGVVTPGNPGRSASGLAADVYIAIRTDGQLGDGTKRDPYNAGGASDAAKATALAAILEDSSKCPASAHIHFGPGTFKINVATGTSPGVGILPLSGWTVEGEGMYVTTIQAIGDMTGVTFDVAIFKTDSSVSTDNVSVKNLTLDCNWDGLRANASVGAGGHTVTDGHITNTSVNFSSLTVNSGWGFTRADVGRSISGTGIPGGTKVATYVDDSHVTMTAAATATNAALSTTFGGEFNTMVAGINVYGSNNLTDGVRVINGYGSAAQNQELFAIRLVSPNSTTSSGNRIENCLAELPAGNYGAPFAIAGYNDTYLGKNGRVINCRAIGLNNGHNTGFTTGGVNIAAVESILISNNQFTDCSGIVYCDTLQSNHIQVFNNTLVRGWQGIFAADSNGGSAKNDWQIIGNTIEIQRRTSGQPYVGIGASSNVATGFVISRNQISIASGGNGTGSDDPWGIYGGATQFTSGSCVGNILPDVTNRFKGTSVCRAGNAQIDGVILSDAGIIDTAIGTGVAAFLATPSSANLATALTDENGSGKAIFAAGTLAITSAKTFTVSNTLTLTGSDGATLDIGTGGTVATNAGTTTNDNAAAGDKGQEVHAGLAQADKVGLTTATAANVSSISLTAGDWDVRGNVNFSATTATVTGTVGGLSSTSATLPVDGSEVYSGVQVTLLSESDSVTLPSKRFSLSGTTTIYLVGKSTFSAGSVDAFGSITARRVR